MYNTSMRCSKCGTEKLDNEFNWRHKAKGIRQSCCKACSRSYCKSHYSRNKTTYLDRNKRAKIENRKKILTILSSKECIDCGEKDHILLDFDHVKGVKRASIASMLSEGRSWNVIEKELLKCVVRCVRCHRIKTAKQFGWYSASEG